MPGQQGESSSLKSYFFYKCTPRIGLFTRAILATVSHLSRNLQEGNTCVSTLNFLFKLMSAWPRKNVPVFNPFKRVYRTTSFATATRQIKIASPFRPKGCNEANFTVNLTDRRIRPTPDSRCSTLTHRPALLDRWTRTCRMASLFYAALGQARLTAPLCL